MRSLFSTAVCLLVSFSSSEGHIETERYIAAFVLRSTSQKFRKRLRHRDELHSSRDASDDDDSIRLAKALQKRSSNNAPWYFQNNNNLPFDCTECGKCCQTKGSVYLSPEEIRNAGGLLGLSESEFINTYASHILPNSDSDNNNDVWIRLKNNKEGSCVFLLDDKHCRIYEARPTQCSTYPFWPSIMKSQSTWNDEVRIPDDQEKSWTIPYWTAEDGGCEGMNFISSNDQHARHSDGADDDKSGVPVEEAHRQLLEYQRAERRFPRTKPIPLGEQDSKSSSKSKSTSK